MFNNKNQGNIFIRLTITQPDAIIKHNCLALFISLTLNELLNYSEVYVRNELKYH